MWLECMEFEMLPDIDYLECHRKARSARTRFILCAIAMSLCIAMLANLAIQDSLNPLLG